jgi:NAD(P)-dependent dehydrogenase (short-subunit alcohol dehydrogenase family)
MKVWFITGASRGIGALVTAEAVKAGDSVVATARDASAISARFDKDPRVLALPFDVTNEAQARQAAARAVERFGRIDVLVNNAGYGLLGAIEEASAAEVEQVFATNVFGLLNVTRAVLPHMRAQRSGHVINMSSIGGYASSTGWGIYCATKFAVEAISESMSLDLEPLGVRTTVVEPGYFRTEFLSAGSLKSTAARIDDYAATVGAMRRFAAGADRQQPGDPAALARGIVTLVGAPQPPRRMPFGSDTVRRIEEKNREVEAELGQWREVALSTDFVRTGAA